ncbi:MAG: hypothetical protein HKN39_03270 [Flavobacteriales bacterium]|nr:hypothetical protein [Flavobacteriales bacterium]
MTQTELEKYMQDPALMNDEVLKELQGLIDQYPYSSTLRMLYLKGLQCKKDITYSKELKKTAIHVSDRSVLYHYLKEERKAKSIAAESEQVLVPVEDEERVEPTKILAEEKKEVATEAKKVEDEQKDLREIDKEIETAKVGSQYILNVSDELPHISELVNMAKSKKKKQKKVKKAQKDAPLDLYSFVESGSEKKSGKAEKRRLKQFIESKEKALKGKKAIYSSKKQAEKSLEESDDLSTETLAKIFVKQEKFEKAIKTYKKLGLKYPEKSVYFAAQIKKVKRLKTKKKK